MKLKITAMALSMICASIYGESIKNYVCKDINQIEIASEDLKITKQRIEAQYELRNDTLIYLDSNNRQTSRITKIEGNSFRAGKYWLRRMPNNIFILTDYTDSSARIQRLVCKRDIGL